jgi:cell division protein FtsZ
MCFITAGMGGGTGTGAAPIIAQAARELGVLTVGVVTKPFLFEGARRMRQAEEGVEALQKVVDTLIIIPNQNLFRLANEKTTFAEAFAMADDVLYQGVKGVTDLMVRPGLINLDFMDVRTVMDEMGKAMMGTGEAQGENRAVEAAEKAIANPLLDEISLEGAKGVLINITGGYDLTLFEVDEAANKIREKVDPDANIIVGSTFDDSMNGWMRVSVVATGIDAVARAEEAPAPRRAAASAVRTTAAEPSRQAPRPASRPAAAPPQPAAARAAEPPQPAPAPAPVQEEREKSLFDDDAFFAAARGEDDYSDIEAAIADDDLPPPAYRPRPEMQPGPTPRAERRADSFVAPQAPAAAGTPTPEAIARLRAAVNRAPEPRGPAADTRAAAPAPRTEADRPRFGINAFINRMTGGHAAEPAPRAQPQAAPRRDDTEAEAEQHRHDIPAFLRRQAN